ncbi:MAG: WYL domain-containing protein [Ktedonobacteraceae bacterium]
MEEETTPEQRSETKQTRNKAANSSTHKALRTVLLAVLFHMYWPRRLSRTDIISYLSPFYGDTSLPALYRDLATLTGSLVEELPAPGAPELDEWCLTQHQQRLLAITYDRQTSTFGLERSLFALEINEDEARAFVALQEGFSPGTPYAGAVQQLLGRWSWLFSEQGHSLVAQKRRRRARPLLLPLSPVEDYSRHGDTILSLDKALEQGTYISFAYTPLSQNWDTQPVLQERAEPYELEYRDGHWYFTAYLPEQGSYVDYRVDRIRPGSVDLSPDRFLVGNRRRRGVKIRYWVAPTLARHGSLSARLQEQSVSLLEDDQGAIVEGYARSIWWARRLLLGYGAQVRALEPEELVKTMREEIQVMAQRYEEEK